MVDLSGLSTEDVKRVTRIHDDLVTLACLLASNRDYQTREVLVRRKWLWDMAFEGLKELEGVNLDG